MYDNYKLTENGLEALFKQECGCSSEGPACKAGKKLYKAYEDAIGKNMEVDSKTFLANTDPFLEKWNEHLGA